MTAAWIGYCNSRAAMLDSLGCSRITAYVELRRAGCTPPPLFLVDCDVRARDRLRNPTLLR
jgi:hypothetical protein